MVRSLVCPSVPVRVRVRLSVSQPSSNDGIFISIIIFICMSCLINAGEANKNLVPFYIIRKSLYIFVFAKTANERRGRQESAEEDEEEAVVEGVGEKPWNRWQWNETNLDFLLSRRLCLFFTFSFSARMNVALCVCVFVCVCVTVYAFHCILCERRKRQSQRWFLFFFFSLSISLSPSFASSPSSMPLSLSLCLALLLFFSDARSQRT